MTSLRRRVRRRCSARRNSHASIALLVGLLGCSASAFAGGLEQLQAFVDGTKSGRAAFTQTIGGRNGKPQQQTSGTFAFARPGRFRWSYDKPFDQLIVGDGRKIWVFDRDLNQVIVRDQTAALGATPAALLAGDNTLEKNFTLVSAGNEGGVEWVDANPKSADSGFKSVRIGFRDDLPRQMELVDAFGQKTQLTFTAFERNARLDASEFQFVPPKGADVVGEKK